MTVNDKLLLLLRQREFWAQLAPDLSIGDGRVFADLLPWALPFRDEAGFRARLDREGYVQLAHVVEPVVRERMAAAIAKLAGLGIPPVFCMVFDLFWVPAFRLSRIVSAALGASHAVLPAFWIWHVDPAKAESGWHPHRDIGHEALFPDRRPRMLTAWLALTDATPLNGCMYVVPAERDPTYGTPDDTRHAFALPDVRALPADAGDVLVWNQALLHWGSHASPLAPAPRMSMSFEFAHEAVETPGLTPIDPTAIGRFEDRLHLIGRQILRYRHLYRLPAQLEAVARSL